MRTVSKPFPFHNRVPQSLNACVNGSISRIADPLLLILLLYVIFICNMYACLFKALCE